MKSQHYVKEFFTESGRINNQKKFLDQLYIDFLSHYDSYGEDSMSSLNKALTKTRDTWNNINKRIPGKLEEGTWKYFYVKFIVEFRDKKFPEERVKVIDRLKKSGGTLSKSEQVVILMNKEDPSLEDKIQLFTDKTNLEGVTKSRLEATYLKLLTYITHDHSYYPKLEAIKNELIQLVNDTNN